MTNVNPNPARFDQKKADAINAAHIRKLTADDFKSRLVPYLQSAGLVGATLTAAEDAILTEAAPLIQERITVLSEAAPMLGFLYKSANEIVVEDDAKAGLPANTRQILDAAVVALDALAETEFKTEAIQNALQTALIDGLGEKPRNAFGPLRTAISGRRISPPLFESMQILGKPETLILLQQFAEAN